MPNRAGAAIPCRRRVMPTHLPLRAVLHPVLDLVLGLEEEILERRRGAPAHAQLVLQVPHPADVHVRRRVGGDCGDRAGAGAAGAGSAAGVKEPQMQGKKKNNPTTRRKQPNSIRSNSAHISPISCCPPHAATSQTSHRVNPLPVFLPPSGSCEVTGVAVMS